jgi:Domain of unknown function (DUF6969)
MNFKLELGVLPQQHLEEMAAAGDEILDAYRVLRKANTNVVGQVLAHQGTFYEEDHYPKGDVYDDETKSQYYYHAHRPETGEHGHFHTFVRAGNIPASIEPAPYDGPATRPLGKDAICHLAAISMNGPGFPVGLFTVNRWVTGETFYTAADTLQIAERFRVDHVYPCLAVNHWITALLRLFRPQLEALLIERDRIIAEWADRCADRDVYEDRKLETVSSLPINVQEQISEVHRALR